MYIEIVCWVGAGFQDCLFQAIMVGEPAPTISMKFVFDLMYIWIVCWVGRVFEIVCFRRLWLVNPPLREFGLFDRI